MSLDARIRQIARQTVKGYISTMTNLTQQSNPTQNTNNSVQLGQIASVDDGSFTVTFSDGSQQSGIPPGGLRPLSVGSIVQVAGGLIVG